MLTKACIHTRLTKTIHNLDKKVPDCVGPSRNFMSYYIFMYFLFNNNKKNQWKHSHTQNELRTNYLGVKVVFHPGQVASLLQGRTERQTTIHANTCRKSEVVTQPDVDVFWQTQWDHAAPPPQGKVVIKPVTYLLGGDGAAVACTIINRRCLKTHSKHCSSSPLTAIGNLPAGN